MEAGLRGLQARRGYSFHTRSDIKLLYGLRRSWRSEVDRFDCALCGNLISHNTRLGEHTPGAYAFCYEGRSQGAWRSSLRQVVCSNRTCELGMNLAVGKDYRSM